MASCTIERVLLTGNRQVGGLTSFATALASGFQALGIAAEVLSPLALVRRPAELRDSRILKILSTTAVFAAPAARTCISVAHGFPRPDAQGWPRTLAILASLKLANATAGCRLAAVSDYVATHLRGIYNLRVDGVIRNPVLPLFTLAQSGLAPSGPAERPFVTYAGRLHPAKNLHRLLPLLLRFLEEDSSFRLCIVGDGPSRGQLQTLAADHPRVTFSGNLGSQALCSVLQQSRIFISGNAMEPFGITYLEALSQGCAVVMPACGGGLEIATRLIGSQVQLFPISFHAQDVLACLHSAAAIPNLPFSMAGYHADEVAAAYLRLAARTD